MSEYESLLIEGSDPQLLQAEVQVLNIRGFLTST